MGQKRLISKRLELFYTRVSEEDRLEKGMGIFEFKRVKHLISTYLGQGFATVVDIGGGTGKYAAWLAKSGHEVHLVDPVPKHVRLAEKRSKSLKNKFKVHVGEARNLPFPDDFTDLVILHGPLYHLQSQADRENGIREAKRVTKPGGILLGFSISYTASTVAGLMQGLIHEDAFLEMCLEELATGMHNPPRKFPWLLAEAYYHRPEDLIREFKGQGLTFLQVHAVEGIVWLDKDFFANLSNEATKNTLMKLLERTEHDRNLLALSPHMMIASRKE